MYDQIREFINGQLDSSYGSVTKQRKALADKLGYSEWTVTHILTGNKEPSKKFLECVADHYGMALVYYKGQYWIVNGEQKGEENADSSY